MRRTTKVTAVRGPLRKAAVPVALPAAVRCAYPAWIDAGERGVAFSAVAVMPRVRDGLVLRVVGRGRHLKSKSSFSPSAKLPPHAPGVR